MHANPTDNQQVQPPDDASTVDGSGMLVLDNLTLGVPIALRELEVIEMFLAAAIDAALAAEAVD